jgi:hypothetical protein
VDGIIEGTPGDTNTEKGKRHEGGVASQRDLERGEVWVRTVGKVTSDDENIMILAETLSKLRFYGFSTLSTSPNL